MGDTNSQKILFEVFMMKKIIIGSFSGFWCIAYVIKRDNIRGQIKDNTFKVVMVSYVRNRTRDPYKLYNPETKRVVISRDI